VKERFMHLISEETESQDLKDRNCIQPDKSSYSFQILTTSSVKFVSKYSVKPTVQDDTKLCGCGCGEKSTVLPSSSDS
jgi:hypothetical protein